MRAALATLKRASLQLVIFLILAAGACVHGARMSWRAYNAGIMQAPCTDALAAFMKEHWQCTHLYGNGKHGLTVQCIGADYAISDTFVSRGFKYTSFLYTNLDTFAQGVCDCDKPQDNACEPLY